MSYDRLSRIVTTIPRSRTVQSEGVFSGFWDTSISLSVGNLRACKGNRIYGEIIISTMDFIVRSKSSEFKIFLGI